MQSLFDRLMNVSDCRSRPHPGFLFFYGPYQDSQSQPFCTPLLILIG